MSDNQGTANQGQTPYDPATGQGQMQSDQQSNIPRQVLYSSSGQQSYNASNTALSSVPGQAIPSEQLAYAQGYPNVTGRSTGRRSPPGKSIDMSSMSSNLDPNIDYFNSKMKQADPLRLHKLIDRYQSEFDFKTYIDNISYQGFNRHVFVNASLTKITVSQFSRLAIMGAIRGSNFNKIKENSLMIDNDLLALFNDGTIVKTPKRKDDISVLRCTASIPQWCAYFMMGANVPPKVVDSNLPPYLQFPAAASLPMSVDLRRLHIEFSIKFSQLIGGAFNPNIYIAAFNNQLPLNEIPDGLRLKLGVNSANESISVGAQNMINELSTQLIKK